MELNHLQNQILKQLSKVTEDRGEKYYFDIEELNIEFNNFTFCFALDFDIDFNDKLNNVNIYSSFIQFEDFEITFEGDYVRKLESELNGESLNY